MKKIKRFLKSNIKLFIGLIIGFVISGGVVSAAILFASNEVSYDNTTSGIQATNVQDAIDELYAKADNCLGLGNIGNYHFNLNKTIMASSTGIKFLRNGNIYEIKTNNYAEEKVHVQEIFNDNSCEVFTSAVMCDASDFYVELVEEGGYLRVEDKSSNTYCHFQTSTGAYCNKVLSTNINVRMNRNETIVATPLGLTIKRNGNLYYIKAGDWDVEKNHIQEIFSDITCSVSSSNVYCYASDVYCYVYSNGRVRCFDRSDNSYCDVRADGRVSCE